MTLNEMFEMVAIGRYYQHEGEHLWICPVCQAQAEAECSKERDRIALKHCMAHHTVGLWRLQGVDLELMHLRRARKFQKPRVQPKTAPIAAPVPIPVLAAG